MNLHLDLSTLELTSYLHQQGWINNNEIVQHIEKPGEGNMNMVLRIKTENRSFILKQANPFVQKYPNIPAPQERVAVEAKFYTLIATLPSIKHYMPSLIGFDAEHHILAVEDLGESADFTFIYQKGKYLTNIQLNQAVDFLSIMHNTNFDSDELPSNLALRQLNHEHLFVYPYLEDNGFNLDTIQVDLQAVAMRYKKDEALKKKMKTLGKVYLSSGRTLLHGDYYPGSWLRTNDTLKVIDPEFCFFGDCEYDLGVLMAHLKMAQAPTEQLEMVVATYEKPSYFNPTLVDLFTGMEIMRRIIGLAQLPLDLTLAERTVILAEAYELIMA